MHGLRRDGAGVPGESVCPLMESHSKRVSAWSGAYLYIPMGAASAESR